MPQSKNPLTSIPIWNVLKAIGKGTTVSELIAKTKYSEASVNVYTSILKKNSLIAIKKDETDPRKKIYTLSKEGLFSYWLDWMKKINPTATRKFETALNNKVDGKSKKSEFIEILYLFFENDKFSYIKELETFCAGFTSLCAFAFWKSNLQTIDFSTLKETLESKT